MRLKALACALPLLVAACGTSEVPSKPQSSDDLNDSADSAPNLLESSTFEYGRGLTATINVSYRYETADQVFRNARKKSPHAYFACIDRVAIKFSTPVNIATLLGKVTGSTSYNHRRSFTIRSIGADYSSFELGSGSEGVCDDHNAIERLTVAKDVRTVKGGRADRDVTVPIHFPAPRNTRPSEDDRATAAPEEQRAALAPSFFSSPAAYGATASTYEVSTSAEASVDAPQGDDQPSDGCARRAPCLVNKHLSSRVSANQYNHAARALSSWLASEARRPEYRAQTMTLLPLEGTVLAPSPGGVENGRVDQYGSPDIQYVLRRAAKFTELMIPGVSKIEVGDLSTRSAETPEAMPGVPAHPLGSHRGNDVDITYLTTGTGVDRDYRYDLERNFWFLYGVLQSSSIDLVMTAYANELRAYAREAHEAGLISDIALGRFLSDRLQQNSGLNHDHHMHISVGNSDNRNSKGHLVSRRFLPSDDVYSCYLTLPRGVAGNFCASADALH